jgi:glutamine synthetase
MGDLASTYIIPAAIKYQNSLLENIKGMKELGLEASVYKTQLDIVKKVSEHINTITSNVTSMIEARKKANEIENQRTKAIAYCDEVKQKHFDIIRYHADKLELMIDDSLWPLPKYRELLFLR